MCCAVDGEKNLRGIYILRKDLDQSARRPVIPAIMAVSEVFLKFLWRRALIMSGVVGVGRSVVLNGRREESFLWIPSLLWFYLSQIISSRAVVYRQWTAFNELSDKFFVFCLFFYISLKIKPAACKRTWLLETHLLIYWLLLIRDCGK